MLRDLKTNITLVQVLVPVARTATATSAAFDLQGFHSAVIEVSTGALTTDASVVPSLTECATSGGDFTAVAAADLIGSFATLTANSIQQVGYRGTKRYVKVVLTAADTKSVTNSVTLIKGNPVAAG